MDEYEEGLLKAVEDLARKAFALFELGDNRLAAWNTLARGEGAVMDGSSPFANDAPIPRRKSSSSSANSELAMLRQQETAAGDACILYCKALGFIVKGTGIIQRYAAEDRDVAGPRVGVELNESKQLGLRPSVGKQQLILFSGPVAASTI
jgi:serine/threonine-protein kinase ULK/ATG1